MTKCAESKIHVLIDVVSAVIALSKQVEAEVNLTAKALYVQRATEECRIPTFFSNAGQDVFSVCQ